VNRQIARLRWPITGLTLAIIALGFLALALSPIGAAANTGNGMKPPTQFEVAENGLRFAFAAAPVHPDGMPAYGNPFVTEGYIYPAGTLNGSNGVLPDGSPEFPEKVIGRWHCRGYMIGDGAHTTTGVWVISTQTYLFNDDYDNSMLSTEGYEFIDLNTPIDRAIIGGTGYFKSARGEQTQTLLGFTAQMGANLRVEIDAKR